MSPNDIIELLKAEGYDKVYVWDATPGEEDPEHLHEFDTKLVILDGEITISIDGEHKTLVEKDELEIPRNKKHAAAVGMRGCSYIVAERH